MNFYTVVIRKSERYWVSLCLENELIEHGFLKSLTKHNDIISKQLFALKF